MTSKVDDRPLALDYPPFFAYFEYLLSIPAARIDPQIVSLTNLNYGAWSVVAYQRSTVILTELVLGAALLWYLRGTGGSMTQRILAVGLFTPPGITRLARANASWLRGSR